MKRKLVATVLAVAMAMSAFTCVYADDTASPFGVAQCDSKTGSSGAVTIGDAQCSSDGTFKCDVTIPNGSTYVTVTYTNGTFTVPVSTFDSGVEFSYGVTNDKTSSGDNLVGVTSGGHTATNKYTVACFKLTDADKAIDDLLDSIVYTAPDGTDGTNAQIKIMATSVSPGSVTDAGTNTSSEPVVMYYGHFYQVVDNGSDITWPEAVYYAHNSTLTLSDGGKIDGYLTNITSVGENEMLTALLDEDTTTQGLKRAWIGATSAYKREWLESSACCPYNQMDYKYIETMLLDGYSVTDGVSSTVDSFSALIEKYKSYAYGSTEFIENVWMPYFKLAFCKTTAHNCGEGADFYWVDGPEKGNTCPDGYEYWCDADHSKDGGAQPDGGQVVYIGYSGPYWDDVIVGNTKHKNGAISTFTCPQQYIIEYGWDTDDDAIEQAESSATVDVVTFNSVTDSGYYTEGGADYGVVAFSFGVNVDDLGTNKFTEYGVTLSANDNSKDYPLSSDEPITDSSDEARNGYWMYIIVDAIGQDDYNTEITATPYVKSNGTKIVGDSVTKKVGSSPELITKDW